jgi:hypothetical protein
VEAIVNTAAANSTTIFLNDSNPSFVENSLDMPIRGSVTAGFMLGITRRD